MGQIVGTGWFALPNAAFELTRSPYEFAVLAYIQRCAGPDGGAWPAHETIAKATHMSRRQVQAALEALQGRGLLSIDSRKSEGQSNGYTVRIWVPGPAQDVPPGRGAQVVRRGAQVVRTNNTQEQNPPVVESLPVLRSSQSRTRAVPSGQGDRLRASACAAVEFTPEAFHVPPETVRRWAASYPGVDVPIAISQAHAWAVANPKQRKANWHRFLVNWLARSQERSRPGQGPPVTLEERAAQITRNVARVRS